MSLTKGAIAQRILKMIGLNSRFTDASPEQVEDVLNYLEDWMNASNGIGTRLGYIQSNENPDPGEESGIPNWAVMGVTNAVAIMVCPYFDRAVHPSIVTNAAAGMRAIEARTIEMAEVQYPNRMPVGTGNRASVFGAKFYQPTDRIRTAGDFLSDIGDDIITSD